MRLISQRIGGLLVARLALNFAAMVFLGVTGFLTWQTSYWSFLFSLRGFAFLLCGVLVSGGLIGAVLTHGHRKLTHWVLHRGRESPSDRERAFIRHTGTLVLLGQFLVVYYLTQWAFTHWVLA